MNSDGDMDPLQNEPEDRRLARGSILGTLSVEEQLEFDRRFLETPTFADLALEVESELVDAYAAGKLTPGEEEALRRWSHLHPHKAFRLDFATVLGEAIEASKRRAIPEPPRHPVLQFFLPLSFFRISIVAATAALLLLTVSVFFFRAQVFPHGAKNAARQAATAAPSPAETAPAPAAPPAPLANSRPPAPVFTAMILADESRDQSSPQVIVVPSACNTVQIQLATEAEIPAGSYSVVLTSAADRKIVWQKSRLAHPGKPFVAVQVPAQLLPSGAYLATLRSTHPSAGEEPLNFQFRIERR